MASQAVACATALLLAELSTASPIISFPINSQVPPVARLGQPFSFVFSPSTFTSTSPITYSLANGPKWLSTDSQSRRLYGTPSPDDVPPGRVTGVSLSLVASDESGSTTSTATLVVSRSPGPKVDIPLEEQVPDFGTFSSPSAILSAPGKAFSFQLDAETFSVPPGSPISYYATMADNTPLPAWISFHSANLSFSGRTPSAESLIQPPQRFSFQLIASDVVGFAGASLNFDIVVGTHRLVADKTTIVLDAIPGTLLSYTGLRDTVKVDGKPAAPGSVAIASVSGNPSWLSVNKHNLHMAGVPPANAESTRFAITLRDTESNNLNLTVLVEMAGDKAGLFTEDSPRLTISPGKPFSFDFRPYLADPRDTDISIEADSSYSWIRFNSTTTTLFGVAPVAAEDSAIKINIVAKSRKSRKTASLPLAIAIRSAADGKGSTPTDSTHPTDGQDSLAGGSVNTRRFNPVLLAVLLPLLLLLGLAVCALFWYFRRRQDRQRPAITTRDISGPIPGTFVTRNLSPAVSEALPDFSNRFGKSFSADDIFDPEKKAHLESRNAFMTRPELQAPDGAVRLLPPSSSPASDHGNSQDNVPAPATASGGLVTLRPGTRGKISSSLSSITETSTIGQLVDSRGLESVGNDSRRLFRDKLEINVPRLLRTPGSAYTASPSPTDAATSPRPGSSSTSPETDAVPLRPESRFSSHPPTSAGRKRSWGWLKGVKGKRQKPKLEPRMSRLSEQPSLLTVDSVASERTAQPSSTISITQKETANEAEVLFSSSLPLPQFPSRASLSRPPSRGRPMTSQSLGTVGQGPSQTNDATTNPATPVLSLTSSKELFRPKSPIRGETPAESLDIYDDITEHNPFRPSPTWSTVPTTDEWVDETVSSLALSRSASQRHQQPNWAVLQESPGTRSRDATTSVAGLLPDGASSMRLPQQLRGGEGEGNSMAGGRSSPALSRPATATTLGKGGDGIRERSGLTQKSQSMGVSLRSEGSRSEYAAFI